MATRELIEEAKAFAKEYYKPFIPLSHRSTGNWPRSKCSCGPRRLRLTCFSSVRTAISSTSTALKIERFYNLMRAGDPEHDGTARKIEASSY